MKKFLFLAALFCVLLLQAGEKLPKYIILFIGENPVG